MKNDNEIENKILSALDGEPKDKGLLNKARAEASLLKDSRKKVFNKSIALKIAFSVAPVIVVCLVVSIVFGVINGVEFGCGSKSSSDLSANEAYYENSGGSYSPDAEYYYNHTISCSCTGVTVKPVFPASYMTFKETATGFNVAYWETETNNWVAYFENNDGDMFVVNYVGEEEYLKEYVGDCCILNS